MSSSERKKKVATGGRRGEVRVRTEGGGDKKKMPPARIWGEGVKRKVRGRAKAGLARLTITGCSQPRQSFFPAPSGELKVTSTRKLRLGPFQRKSTNIPL